jgi:hypothetical protein
MNRIGYKWNINECLRLQREFELLCLTIDEIAVRHKRTPKAIMFKLDEEGFATYTDLYNGYHGLNKFEIKYPLNQTLGYLTQIQLSDSESGSESKSKSETSDNETATATLSESESESDVGSYYNMRTYIKQLENQVSNLLDYIKQNVTSKPISLQNDC